MQEPAGRYVLVVDDEAEIRLLVSHILARRGYAAREAANGRDALSLLRAERPALILLDLYMPVMSGLEFLDALEQLPPPHPPVVLFSALSASVPDEVEARVAAVIGKPVRVETLLETVGCHWPPPLHPAGAPAHSHH